MPDTTTQPAAWRELAIAALLACRDRQYKAAAQMLTILRDEHGPVILGPLLLTWTDMTLTLLGVEPGTPTALRFYNTDTGAPIDPEQVEPHRRWAARFIAARLSGDLDQADALVASLHTPSQLSEGIGGVLLVCGELLRRGQISAPQEAGRA